MDQHESQDKELHRFRVEAAELLKIKEATPELLPLPKESSPQRHRDTEKNHLICLLCASASLWFKKNRPVRVRRKQTRTGPASPRRSVCAPDEMSFHCIAGRLQFGERVMLSVLIRNSRLNRLVVPLIVLVAVVSLACATAHAQVKPFKITGGGVGPLGLPLPGQDPRPHSSVGEATHLGRYTGIGTLRTDSAAFDPATGHITGEFGSASPYVFTGADGDELVCYYGRTDFGASTPGTFELTIVDFLADGSLVVEALFIAEFVAQPDDCTGKFAGVTGSWIMVATTEPFVLGSDDPINYSWHGEGSLTFKK